MTNSEPVPYELTDAGARRFAEAGVDDAERDRWLTAGFGPFAALNHLRLGVNLDEAQLVREAGLSSNDLELSTRQGLTVTGYIADLTSRTGANVSQLRKLFEQGFKFEDIEATWAAGLSLIPESVIAAKDAERFGLIIELGVAKPDALKWLRAGLDLQPFAARTAQPAESASSEQGGHAPLRLIFDEWATRLHIHRDDLLLLLTAGFSAEQIDRALSAGASIEFLQRQRATPGSTKATNNFINDVVEILSQGIPIGTLTAWVAADIELRAIRAALRKGTKAEDVPWIVRFPRVKEREGWRRITDSLDDALRWQRNGLTFARFAPWRHTTTSPDDVIRWHRYGLQPENIVDGRPASEFTEQIELLRRVGRLGIDEGTDYPCQYQADAASDGRFQVSWYELDEDGYLTGEVENLEMDLQELLRVAIASRAQNLEFGGLTAAEAARLLSAPGFVALTSELLDESELGDEGIRVNGVDFVLRSDRLVNEGEGDE